MTDCIHLEDNICEIASMLAGVTVATTENACKYCSFKATPLRDVNKVTVSLAYKANPAKRADLIKNYKHLLTQDIVLRQREHWRKLHTSEMDAMKFSVWLKEIPNQCNCGESFNSLLETNPPRFDDWHRWTWEIHNAVNRKLGKLEVTWDDAVKIWGWSQQHSEILGQKYTNAVRE